MLTNLQYAICALLMQARGHYDTLLKRCPVLVQRALRNFNTVPSLESMMPSITSFCRVYLVGILALSACVESKELTSTTVTDGTSLGAALKRENIEVIKVKGAHLL